ncbi:hypothetical protein BDE36_1137 [Arcticibacter tournemirensis]|uniref:Glycosyl transferase n=1 Tax=Arcticibacter tournemirensis TaxID=699437 RepID=A0A5M9HAI4_9SPHI|nr:hypothetical protein [Arcticibacter tournemirensis]KAA8482027.1 hypothetical protein F1649_12865 [Arcticibacter tournemirensis]TQM49432.1 hypothetical protein BDE36_1137 [Arcticibacter tournemirensis]
MNNKVAFTICSKNYIGLAAALEKSFRLHNPDSDFFIFLADELSDSQLMEVPQSAVVAKGELELSANEWTDMSFKYDVVEFCTAIKPFCFQVLLNRGYEKAIYFDPDILVFDALDYVYEKLETTSVIVVPHEVVIGSDNPQRGGIYNLGFLALKSSNASNRLLKWWGDRLKTHAFSDPIRGFFTDQKWMDHLPVVLEAGEYYVSKHLGLNYAPWNFDEREILVIKEKYYIRLKTSEETMNPLVFFHFSAFKYEELSKGNYSHKTVDMKEREEPLYNLIRFYGDKIQESNFKKYLQWPYSYGVFSNGRLITLSFRRIYARLVTEDEILVNPFQSDGEFYNLLKKGGFVSKKDINVERLSIKKVSGLGFKVRVFDLISKLLIAVIGYDRYSLLGRFLIRYFHLNNRARLLNRSYRRFKIESF